MAKVNISRPIKDVTINGDEYLLDENQNPMEFNSKQDAKQFLLENGFDLSFDEMDDHFNFPKLNQ